MKYKNVVWDWNGTLLNDVKVGVNTLNDMLGRRGLPLLSVEDYKEKFGFPVIDFYDRVGFDMEKESFHELSVDFVETYDKYAGEVGLNEGVREVLAGIQQTGVKQYVLSALREDLLQQMLRHFQIDSRFDRACGANDLCGRQDRTGTANVTDLSDCTRRHPDGWRYYSRCRGGRRFGVRLYLICRRA